MRVLSVIGTRPEAVKMAPLIRALQGARGVRGVVCATAQHRQMLDQVIEEMAIPVDYDLDAMRQEQSLPALTATLLSGLDRVLAEAAPDLVLVQGDTTTAFAGALAAFYRKIAVGHVEAGLRSFDAYSPYPEEMNRALVDRIAALCFAPTPRSRGNLLREGIAGQIRVTGNTAIDALRLTVDPGYAFVSSELKGLDLDGSRWIVATAHRRENQGDPLRGICRALARLASDGGARIVFPVHKNPAIRRTVEEMLGGIEGIRLIEPLGVRDMHNLLARCYMVLTDSGGLQEEAPFLGKPVLVLRGETERPEAVEAGAARLVGIGEDAVYAAARELLDRPDVYRGMARAVNPFGDGHASPRIVGHILGWGRERGLCP